MFFVDGFISFSTAIEEIYGEMRANLQDWTPPAENSNDIEGAMARDIEIKEMAEAYTQLFIWEFCEKVKYVGVLPPHGQVIHADRGLVRGPTDAEKNIYGYDIGPYVSLNSCTVGSGFIRFDHAGEERNQVNSDHLVEPFGWWLDFKLRERFGPFLHCPVVFKELEFRDFVGRSRSAIGRDDTEFQSLSTQVALRRARGRPPRGDGYLEKAVRYEFSRRKREGLLQLDQRESIWAEVDSYARDAFGEGIARETARRYLADILGEMPAQK
jgi:hypothetical protein